MVISGLMVVGLPVNSEDGFPEVFEPPDGPFEGFVLEKILVFLNEFLGSQLDVLIE